MGKATVEHWYHRQYLLAYKEKQIPHCPTALGIDEHFWERAERAAYGFRNFENYRLRVKVLCG